MTHTLNISKSYLFKLSIPIFFSNIAIPFVGLVDTGLMGHLGSGKYLAAIGIATSIITMIFWSFGFLRMGTVGLISQSLGRKDWNEITLIFVRNLILATFFGFFIIFQIQIFIKHIILLKLYVKSFIIPYINVLRHKLMQKKLNQNTNQKSI